MPTNSLSTLIALTEDAFERHPVLSIMANLRDLREEDWTAAPCNGEPIGGLKVTTENGWFAARPSGTEELYKIYAESMLGEDHLRQIQSEARAIVDAAFGKAGVTG